MMNMSTLLGGMGGSTQSPMASLLGQYYNPADMKKQMLMNGIQQFGLGLLGQGYSPIKKGILGEIGTGIKAGVEGANQAKEDYEKSAFSAYSLDREMQQDKREEEEAARKEQERAQRAQALEGFYSQLDPSKRAFAQAFPEQAAPHFAKQMFPETQEPKAPTVQTFFDQKSGQEYKAQWNPQTGQWEKIGGSKVSGEGIVIENADGTRTIIGGGGGGKETEGARRIKMLTKQIVAQKPTIEKSFEALGDARNYIGAQVPGGRVMMSPAGKQAEDAMKNAIANWLYVTSGATANPGEVENQFQSMRPHPSDDPVTRDLKKARLMSIFQVLQEESGVPDVPGMGGAAGAGPGGATKIGDYTIKQVSP